MEVKIFWINNICDVKLDIITEISKYWSKKRKSLERLFFQNSSKSDRVAIAASVLFS